MKASLKYIFITLFLLSGGLLYAQFNPDKICTIDNGRTVFRIDLRWSEEERHKLEKLFDLDSILISRVFSGEVKILLDSTVWQVKRIAANIVELSELPKNIRVKGIGKNNLFIADDSWVKYGKYTRVSSSEYGVNNFMLKDAFTYHNKVAQFFLPGFTNAKNIFISGSFNEWSISESRMQRCDSGWIAKLNLSPGKYLYKYIIDGRWTQDINNKLKVKDGEGSCNSIVFCYNYSFQLKERKDARKVILAGSFNNWNRNELTMTKSPGGWILPIFLREGTHAYKFIVDGEWMNDPANKQIRPDGNGNYNSYIGIGDAYSFHLTGFEKAKKVILSGNFNAWSLEELEMEKTADGWKLDYILAPGMYEYKFIVDGNWITDPGNPFTEGSGSTKNSVLVFKPNHTFKLAGFVNARAVLVTGNFTNWSEKNYRMSLKNGVWVFPYFFAPGKYTYKFVVDGKWILDPSNNIWEENEYNTGNSILWISQ